MQSMKALKPSTSTWNHMQGRIEVNSDTEIKNRSYSNFWIKLIKFESNLIQLIFVTFKISFQK